LIDSTSAAGPKLGVLLVNTGTPDAPTSRAVSRFLRRFLSDPRVIELPRLLWLPLLYGLILPLRSPRSARKYREIWQEQGSPLRLYTSQLRSGLERALAAGGADAVVADAFLYAPPFIDDILEAWRAQGVRRLFVLPLFPQSSGSTTGAVFDRVGRSLTLWRALPELRCCASYFDDPAYIGALAASVREHWAVNGRDSHLLLSFHGIPESYVARGDRYAEECRQTAAQLAAALGLTERDCSLSYQSRFGSNRWLTPATEDVLRELPARARRRLTVLCPGFAADCLETLEEIALTGRAIFLGAGGESFHYVPALNAREDHASALARLILRSTGDWT
jgi:protoporphyrin/coproporphyrin ferrochelatase